MSKYTITHSCGCAVEHSIYGTNVNGERERKAQWLSEQPCTDCKRKTELEAATKSTRDLPELTGSPKQVAWATSIRAKAASEIRPLMNMVEERLAGVDQDSEMAKQGAIMLDVLRDTLNQADSSYWIDNRGQSFDQSWAIAAATERLTNSSKEAPQ